MNRRNSFLPCEYCGSAVKDTRCDSCGAPVRSKRVDAEPEPEEVMISMNGFLFREEMRWAAAQYL